MSEPGKYPMRPASAVDWAAVAERYADLVYSVAIKFRLQPHDAAEMFQNAWVTALTRESVPEEAGMAPWLAAIACWEARNLLRKRRSTPLEDGAAEAVADAEEPEPEHVAAQAEQEQAVREALALLPRRDRELIQDLFLSPDPLPYVEVAARLGIAVGSIGMLRRRALDRMRAALGG